MPNLKLNVEESPDGLTWTFVDLDTVDFSNVTTFKADVTGDLTGDVTGVALKTVEDNSEDGAIDITDEYHLVTKATAAALTLEAASTANSGYVVKIKSTTLQAHVITAEGADFSGWGASEGNNTATFGGAVGDGLTLVSDGTNWICVENVNVTFTTV